MEMAGFDYSTDVDLTAAITAENSLFSLYLLSPNTNPARNTWAVLLEGQLEKIGIHVPLHLSTGWSTIIPLTFGSEVPCPPGDFGATQSELSGWDLFFVGYSWQLDYKPIGLFDSASIRPFGDNIYNFPGDVATYEGVSWDDLVDGYLNEVDDTVRVERVHKLQEFMYEWEPVATIIYPISVLIYHDTVTGIDALLISITAQQWGRVDCARTYEIEEPTITTTTTTTTTSTTTTETSDTTSTASTSVDPLVSMPLVLVSSSLILTVILRKKKNK
jgi:hypothetical protein